MRRYALRDDQSERIRDLLPGREGHVGVTARDNRLFVEAVIYRYQNFFCNLKKFRAIATRYDNTARNFLAAIHLVAAFIWLN